MCLRDDYFSLYIYICERGEWYACDFVLLYSTISMHLCACDAKMTKSRVAFRIICAFMYVYCGRLWFALPLEALLRFIQNRYKQIFALMHGLSGRTVPVISLVYKPVCLTGGWCYCPTMPCAATVAASQINGVVMSYWPPGDPNSSSSLSKSCS